MARKNMNTTPATETKTNTKTQKEGKNMNTNTEKNTTATVATENTQTENKEEKNMNTTETTKEPKITRTDLRDQNTDKLEAALEKYAIPEGILSYKNNGAYIRVETTAHNFVAQLRHNGYNIIMVPDDELVEKYNGKILRPNNPDDGRVLIRFSAENIEEIVKFIFSKPDAKMAEKEAIREAKEMEKKVKAEAKKAEKERKKAEKAAAAKKAKEEKAAAKAAKKAEKEAAAEAAPAEKKAE